ncbi:hypothetical protein [Streptomyces sp. NPDC050485]|uniref:hypothetical protein n=1 Tax=Streptomyces sp. NPDC050485 TaxID=3365617 RepID=UPI0037AA6D20
MTNPADRPAPPLTCPPAHIGPCAICRRPCHRYGGRGASSLCRECLARVEAGE